MRRFAPVVTVLLLVTLAAMTSVAAGPIFAAPDTTDDARATDAEATLVQSSEPATSFESSTTVRLWLDDPVVANYSTPSADLAGTLAIQDDSIRHDFTGYSVDHETALDASEDEQRQNVEDALERIDRRTAELEDRERRAVRGYADGTVSDRELLRTLARNHREAESMRATLDVLNERASAIPGLSLNTHTIEMQLQTHQSPLRDRVVQTMSGFDRAFQPELFSIEASDDGLVVSTLERNQYVREAIRYDNRDLDRPDQFGETSQAFDRAQEIYPLALGGATQTYRPYADVQLYSIRAPHSQGTLIAYLDGGTGEIYRELQELHLDRLPTAVAGEPSVGEGLVLTINQTPRNGPIEVTVTDADTGEPIDATIVIDGQSIDRTRDDGTLWAIPPRSDEYRVTATAGSRSVTATVAWTG